MRNNFLLLIIINLIALSTFAAHNQWSLKQKGLVWGSLYGDAFGGPYEFQAVDNHYLIKKDKKLTAAQWKELADSVKLVDYKIKKSPYGPWTDMAPKGTITDDSRHKIIFWKSLNNKAPNSKSIAKSYMQHFKMNSQYKEWLSQYYRAACFEFNNDHKDALPVQRLWAGMPTQAGQMIYPLNALFYVGNPNKAYRQTYKINKFDNGEAQDFTSALVAGLAYALGQKSDWPKTAKVIENTDPLEYSKIPFVQRKLSVSIKLANKLVRLAQGNPKKLFSMLEENLNAKTWWEADVAFTISYAFLQMTKHEPLAALALTREFGHDVDSYAQLIGAYLGAIHTEKIFNSKEISIIKDNIQKNYGDVFLEFE